MKKLAFFGWISIVVMSLLWVSCSDDSDSISMKLDFVEETLPAAPLSAGNGTFEIEVEWSNTRWRLIAGEVVSGQAFIENIAPSLGGENDGSSKTVAIIEFKHNGSDVINQQNLILSSFDGEIRRSVIITQSDLGDGPYNLHIDPSTTFQEIDGFGGANYVMWGSDYLRPGEMESAFGMDDDGLGLSIFRVRLSSNRNDWAGLVNVIKDANSRGVKVLASPWSPPAIWKSNNSTNGGGYLLHEHYGDFANYINEFITFMNDNGAVIDVVSIQNEPDWEVSYEGCEYTVEEMFNFMKYHAGSIEGAKVLAAESLNNTLAYSDAILNDPTAADNLDIVGFHLYGSGVHPNPLAEEIGKKQWMTEHLYNLDSGNNPNNWTADTDPAIIWDETMLMINDIHDGMELNWNAYIWWYIRRYYSFIGDGINGTTRGEILKRGYAMSQYSRFVRPGYIRIEAAFEAVPEGIKVTAYKGDNKTVAVIVNNLDVDDYAINVTAPIDFTKIESYTTSLHHDREKIDVVINDNVILVELPAKSVTTVVIDQ